VRGGSVTLSIVLRALSCTPCCFVDVRKEVVEYSSPGCQAPSCEVCDFQLLLPPLWKLLEMNLGYWGVTRETTTQKSVGKTKFTSAEGCATKSPVSKQDFFTQ
jgi:hypothetical protein